MTDLRRSARQLRTVVDDLKSIQPPIGLIICDEGIFLPFESSQPPSLISRSASTGHRLKSSGAKVTKALRSLNCKRRIIMTGTPIQNDLQEYHTMVGESTRCFSVSTLGLIPRARADFVNPGCLDTYSTFKKGESLLATPTYRRSDQLSPPVFESPILKSREPNASAKVKEVGTARNDQLQRIGQAFMLRRTGEVISKYLPPKRELFRLLPSPPRADLPASFLSRSRVHRLHHADSSSTRHLRQDHRGERRARRPQRRGRRQRSAALGAQRPQEALQYAWLADAAVEGGEYRARRRPSDRD